jgi:predicted DNA-binding protein with PD1-like motif
MLSRWWIASLLMAGVAGAQSLPKDGDLLPPTRTLAHGKAPQMHFQLLGEHDGVRTFAVIFGTGDEVLAGLTEFAEEQHLGASQVTGIGALHEATLGWLDLERKSYRAIVTDEQVEVTSMVGDIALLDGKPVVHVHMNLGHRDGHVTGGHLLEAFVRPTLEVIVTEYPHALQKQRDPMTGMSLIKPRP